jgi:two-component system chemotaxis response regulator CheY
MLRFLIADDCNSVQQYLQAIMKRYGECTAAWNGREAVALFDEAIDEGKAFDLVLMDIMMPVMDGLSAVSAIRNIERKRLAPAGLGTKIIMVSCLSDSKHMLTAQYDCGADAYLTKPLELDALIESLRNLQILESNVADEEYCS